MKETEIQVLCCNFAVGKICVAHIPRDWFLPMLVNGQVAVRKLRKEYEKYWRGNS